MSRRPYREGVTDSYVYAAARTPFGRFNGALAGLRPDDLAALAVRGVLARTPRLDPAGIGDVVWGNANGAGEDNRNVGRMAVLLAGLPTSVPATTVNRLCGSSLDAAMIASRAIETGDADIVLTGGVESMTRAPWVLPKPARGFPAGDVTAVSTTLGWRLVNPRMPKEWTVSLGEANEQLAERFGIPRDRQDAFAARSHRLADAAWRDGFYADLVVPVETDAEGGVLDRDEGIRPGSTPEKLAGLKPAFRPDGVITAGNASPLNDGASAVLLGSGAAAERVGTAPLARVAGRGASALDPQDFGFAPVEAANRALKRAGITWSDVAAVELNEAFAVQSLACVDAWGIDPAVVNTKGGAIALGHPLGASGGRILGTLAHRLKESGDRWGVAAICIGVGQALAVVLENVTGANATDGHTTAAKATKNATGKNATGKNTAGGNTAGQSREAAR
ncbi:thiolase family protein [Streptomyces griseoviridis]|jgi:acetyl-CoA acyltransferase|uniref:thiolase family protein n=1 Tax=Streptomyces griseoviridis TaxID=45398 RepID=UPI00351C4A8F